MTQPATQPAAQKNSPAGYTKIQIALHWIVALLIIPQFALGENIEHAWTAFKKGEELGFNPLVMSHVVFGFLVLIFVVWRLKLRLSRGVPALPEKESTAMKMAAHVTHWTLYALMILMPVSGAMAWFGEVGFGAEVHNLLKKPLLILIVLHILAALLHQFVLKTDLITRMKRADPAG